MSTRKHIVKSARAHAVISRLYNKKVSRFEKDLHDMREDVFDIFALKDIRHVRAYYEAMARPQRKIANWGALNFGLIRFFLLGIFVVVLFIVIDIDNFSTGRSTPSWLISGPS